MARRFGFALALAATRLLLVPSAAAEPAIFEPKTSLVWLFGDDDLVRPASSTLPASLGLGAGDRPGYGAFFDSLAHRDRGRESALVLHRAEHASGWMRGVDTFAELNLSLPLEPGSDSESRPLPSLLEDRGSRLGLRWDSRASVIQLDLFPFDSDRVRIGALRELSFGGTDVRHADSSFPGARAGVPALRLELEAGPVRAFIAGKWGEGVGRAAHQALPGFLVEFAWNAASWLKLQVAAGAIRYPNLSAYSGPNLPSFGAAFEARLLFAQGLSELYAPFAFDAWLLRTRDGGERSGWGVALEASVASQRLGDFDRPGQTRNSRAGAAALSLELTGAGIDSSVALWARELGYVVRDVPGLFPGQSLPRAARSEPELSLAISSVCTRLGAWVPELSAGLRLPSTFTPASETGRAQPVIVRGPGDFAASVAGTRRLPLLETRVALSVRASKLLVFGAFLSYRRDNNRTALVREEGGVLLRTFIAPDFLGAGLLARAELSGP